jgi:DNA polymerase-3 subunit beta
MTFALSIERDRLLGPLTRVAAVVEKKQTLPILGNILMELKPGVLSVTGSDSEVQLQSDIAFDYEGEPSAITVTGRKLVDICRVLPANALLTMTLDGAKLVIKSGKSRFSLATLPADEFPLMEQKPADIGFDIPQILLKHLLAKTHFSMAQQDVRYYLNSSLLDLNDQQLTCVATDGHRLSCCKQMMPQALQGTAQLLVPRKGVLELQRLLQDTDEPVQVAASSSTIKVTGEDFVFTSKLMDGKYPNYQDVIPKSRNILIVVDRAELQTALQRVAILSHEKFRGVRWQFENNELRITAHNPEQEWGEEVVEVDYSGEPLHIDFNVAYLLDVLSAIDEPNVVLALSNDQSSLLIEGEEQLDQSQYVVMPMQI